MESTGSNTQPEASKPLKVEELTNEELNWLITIIERVEAPLLITAPIHRKLRSQLKH